MQPPSDPLDTLLERWRQATPAEPERLEPEVWRRIAVADNNEKPSLLSCIRALFSRPSFSVTFAAACTLLALFIIEARSARQQGERNLQLVQSYLHLVDPLLAPQASATLAPDKNLESMLAWMKEDLKLNEQQLTRIKAVHEQQSPRLIALARQVAKMEEEFVEFEHERQTVGQIDFLEFARYVELRRRLDRECADSTQRLVSDAAGVMTPQQRQQYLSLLVPALQKRGGGSL